MPLDIITIQLVAILNSPFMAVFKFLMIIYVTVVFVDIVLLLILRGLGANIKESIKGAQMPLVSAGKMRKQWMKIENRISDIDLIQNKLAILEADTLVDRVLQEIGYSGKNMTERLEKANEAQIEQIDDLREAHHIRNNIIQDKNIVINSDKVKEVLQKYKGFLEQLEMI